MLYKRIREQLITKEKYCKEIEMIQFEIALRTVTFEDCKNFN